MIQLKKLTFYDSIPYFFSFFNQLENLKQYFKDVAKVLIIYTVSIQIILHFVKNSKKFTEKFEEGDHWGEHTGDIQLGIELIDNIQDQINMPIGIERRVVKRRKFKEILKKDDIKALHEFYFKSYFLPFIVSSIHIQLLKNLDFPTLPHAKNPLIIYLFIAIILIKSKIGVNYWYLKDTEFYWIVSDLGNYGFFYILIKLIFFHEVMISLFVKLLKIILLRFF